MNKKGREILKRLLSQDVCESHSRPETLMEKLVSGYKEHGPSNVIPDTEYILSETLDHFWAGVTTTGDALAAAFYYVSQPANKPRQEKLRHELRNAGTESGGGISLAKVKDVAYLDFVIRETSRHSQPVASSLSRRVTAQEGMEVLGYWIPPGVSLVCHSSVSPVSQSIDGGQGTTIFRSSQSRGLLRA